MYITSFYSFKGGVGRSLALVNVGIELAKRNHRVLVVDFDLEAPGLDTVGALKPTKNSLGIVDFVNSYLTTGKADVVEEYVCECKPPNLDKGSIWLMPAGYSKLGYVNLYLNIDWEDLYTNQNGFLLMEELKQQWKKYIQPDYVLIDSPTGHTDVGSICTRHIPDAVAIFFFPNEENLRGINRIVSGIKMERENLRKKHINLHFVMSNVPDLEESPKLLKKSLNDFKHQLDLEEEPIVVHHYNSPSLLTREVFTQRHPTSRLANEYRQIVDRIVNGNDVIE